MRNQLVDYDLKINKIPVFCDNPSAIDITENLVPHSRNKHINIKYLTLLKKKESTSVSLTDKLPITEAKLSLVHEEKEGP